MNDRMSGTSSGVAGRTVIRAICMHLVAWRSAAELSIRTVLPSNDGDLAFRIVVDHRDAIGAALRAADRCEAR